MKQTLLDLAGTTKEEAEEIVQKIDTYYLSYPIKKADNKKLRWIDAPQGRLKEIQYNILYNILYKFTPHKAAVGFRVGMGVHDGAKRHLDNQVVLTMDISNFFNSIKIQWLYRIINGMHKRLQKRKHVAMPNYVKGKDVIFDEMPEENQHVFYITSLLCYKGQLPQGAPTSPVVANLFALRLDGIFQHFADTHKLVYTRYADDITFSHADKSFNIGQFIPLIEETLQSHGLEANYKKTRILRPHKRMVVTGIVINDKLGVPKYKWRNLRAKLHNLKRDNKILTIKEYQKIRGYCEWIKVLNKKRGEQLITQLGQIPLETL